MSKTKRYALLAIYCSLAIVINVIENLIFPPLYFGIRLGLANIISLITLNKMGLKDMFIIVILRLTLGNLLKGSIFGTPFIISALGLIFSTTIITLLNSFNCSILFISMISSIFHTIGQLVAVCYIYNSINIFYVLPILLIISILTGLITGYISKIVLNRN